MDYPKLSNCSGDYVAKALKRLGGFSFMHSPKHFKVTHTQTSLSWMIPRHSPLKRGFMWDMVRNYLQTLGFAEQEIFKNLWC